MKKFLLSVAAVAMTLGASAQEFYVVGGFNGWNEKEAVQMEVNAADATATVHFDSFDTNFKIIGQRDWNGLEYGAVKGETLKIDGTPMALAEKGSNDNIMFADGISVVKDCTLTLDISAMTLKATGTADNGPQDLYISGSFQTPAWAIPGNEGTQVMTLDGDVYSVVCAFNGTAEAPAAFKIATKGWGVEYAATKDSPVLNAETLSTTLKAKADGGDTDIKVALTGNYKVAFNIKDLTLTLSEDKEQGINEVVVDNNVEAVYYNLQGVRVANPENGVFIVKRGNEVSKVLVK